jgi:succinoglycan biosynthesis transport protein ExoP
LNTPSQPNNSLQQNSPSDSLVQSEVNPYSPAEVRNEYSNSINSHSSGRYVVEESSGLDFAHIFSILRRRWKIMLLVFSAVLMISIYFGSKELPIYESSATLEIASTDSSNVFQGVPGFNRQSERGNMATQLALLQSGQLRQRAVKRLPPDEQKRLGEVVSVEASLVQDTNLLLVKVQSLNPKLSAEYANAICNEYIDSSQVNNRKRSTGAISYVEDQLQIVRKDLEKAQSRLTEYKKKTGIFSVDSQAEALGSRVYEVKAALEESQTERAATIARLGVAQQMLASVPKGNVVPGGLTRNEQAVELQARLGELDIERQSALEEFTPTSYRVKSIDTQIAATKRRLATLSETVVEGYIVDPRRQPLEQEVATAQSTLKSLDARIRALGNQLGIAEGAYKNLPDQEYQFLTLAAEVQTLAGSATMLSEKLNSLRLTANAKVADGVMQSKAEPAHSPVGVNKNRRILSSLAFAIVAALGAALLWDLLDNRIYSDDDAQRSTGLPVLAQIPLEKRVDNQLVLNSGQKMSPVLESFRMLRANIAFSGADRPIRSIVVTSSLPNEGKSTTALNLATTAALGGESVILLDLDLRRPTQHSLIGINNTPGFVNVILGNNTLEEVIQETEIDGLRVVTCGSIPPNPFKILNSDASRQLIHRLVSMADFVVIDTPPLLGLADARLISSIVDGTIMVVACEETKRREASRAADLLHTSNGEIIGSVFTKVPHSSSGYSDYYTYRSYSKALEEGKEEA